MPRYQNPADINFYQGEPTPNGLLFFFESGTSTPKATYADIGESVQNSHPVLLDAAGREPNIFYSGSAKVVLQNSLDEQVWERDPVGGESTLGNFSEYNSEIIYSQNDIVTDGGKFYLSLSNNNVGNDPTLETSKWMEIRFIGVWNSTVVYSIGDVVQTTDGNLWKALTATAGNNPLTDEGENWTRAINEGWRVKTENFTAFESESYLINGAFNTVDVTLPVLTVGKSYTFHNETTSTNKVQILNPDYTINGASGSILAGTDLELEPGNSVQFIAKDATILEIVGVQV